MTSSRTRAFVFRIDDFSDDGHLYLAIPDRGDAPPRERRLASDGGAVVFAPAADEMIEVVAPAHRGLAAIAAAAGDHALCIGDPALASEGAARGLPVETPTPSVVASATVAALTAAWGRRASRLAHVDTFLALIRAAGAVAATVERTDERVVDPTPLHAMFLGRSNHPHFSPISSLIRTDMADDIAGFTLAVRPRDVPAIADAFARGQTREVRAFDVMYVGLKRGPASIVRLIEHLHGCAFVPDVIRIHDGELCPPDDADLMTIAAALELRGHGAELVRVGDVRARVVGAAEAERVLAGHVEPVRVALDDPPAGAPLSGDWLGYLFAATDALLGKLPDAYAGMMRLVTSSDVAVREHAVRGAAQIMPHLSQADFDRLT